MTRANLRFQVGSLDEISVYIIDPVEAKINDISQGGMAVHTLVPLHIGSTYRFRITAPNSSVSLDGEVVRCKVEELSEDLDGSHFPLYTNGVRFMIQRNPIEISLLEIMHANIRSERRASPRMKPLAPLEVQIAHGFDCKILSLTTEAIVLRSREIPEMDDELDLLLQVAYETLTLPTRLVHVSKREGEDAYVTQFEFTHTEPYVTNVIECLLASLASD